MENNELDLSRIWKKQPSVSPDYNDLLNRIRGYKKGNMRKKIISNISLVATILIILSIWFLYDASTVYPKLGMSLIILAISISLIKFNQFYRTFNNLDKGLNNNEYLKTLLEIERKQKSIQVNFMNIYFILLSIGLLVYMYEFSLRMNNTTAIAAYGLTFGWITFVWIYLKPKMAKKQNAKLEKLVNSIQNIIQNQ